MGGREQRVRITLWRQGSSPERGHSTIPRVEQPPHKTGWDVVPQRPQQEAGGAPTHPWRVLNGGRLPPPRGEDPSSPRASNRGCSTHSLPEWGPAPTPAPRPTASPRTPEMGGATPEQPRRGVPSSLGPQTTRPLAPEWGVPSPPRAPPSGTFRPSCSGSRRPSSDRTGPLGPGRGVRRVHSESGEGRKVRNRYLLSRRSPPPRPPL